MVREMATATVVTPKKENAVYVDDGKKNIHDPIYGTMRFHEAIVKIIDTKEIQRLRNIKKHGGAHYFHHGEIHSRFDHSLGTAYLCGKLLSSLQQRQKDVLISEKNVLCVQIAGLCHDLGQGPFSRVYKHEYLGKSKGIEWSESDATLKIFEMILGKDIIQNVFGKYGIKEDDVAFIKDAMVGEIPQNPSEHRFLYEIVKNQRNGIDCSALDVMQRDCYFAGKGKTIDISMYFLHTKICKVNNEYRLCFDEDEASELVSYLHTWQELHQKIYQHQATVAIDLMLGDVMSAADPVLPEIYEAHENHNLLLDVCDCSMIEKISHLKDSGLERARDILKRIDEGSFYKICGEKKLESYPRKDTRAFCREVASKIARQDPSIKEDDFIVDIAENGVSEEGSIAVQNIDFFNRGDDASGEKVERFYCATRYQYIRVYAREDKNKKKIAKMFDTWYKNYKTEALVFTTLERGDFIVPLAVLAILCLVVGYTRMNR